MAEWSIKNLSKRTVADRKATYGELSSALQKNNSQTVEYYELPDLAINYYCKQLIIISYRQFFFSHWYP